MNVWLPLARLERLAGHADEDVLCAVDPGEWEDDVAAMMEELDAGWEPPPLLARGEPDRRLVLEDGNHRFEALHRQGATARGCSSPSTRPRREMRSSAAQAPRRRAAVASRRRAMLRSPATRSPSWTRASATAATDVGSPVRWATFPSASIAEARTSASG